MKHPDNNDPCRIHIYDPDDQGRPGNEILNRNIIISNDQSQGKTVSVDVSEYNVYCSSAGIYIGIEWLGKYEEEHNSHQKFRITRSIPEARTYTRTLGYRNWILLDQPATTPSSNPINLLVSIIYEQ